VARYEIREDEARVVRSIFQWIGRERVSIGAVCRRLRQEGCPSPRGKDAWDRSTVWGILKNPAYAGMAAFGKTRIGPLPARLRPARGGHAQPRRAYGVCDVAPGEWIGVPVPPLVDAALFAAVGEQLAENRRRNRQHARGQRYLLQGLIVCRQCGYAYYGKAISPSAAKGKRRNYAYYRCCGSDAYRFGGERLCANPQVRTDRLDEAVWREVDRVLEDPGRIAAEYERRLAQARRPGAGDLAGVEAQIAKLRRGMGRLIDSYTEGLIDKAEFEPRIAGLRQRIQGWEEQAASLREEATQRAALALIVGRLQDFARQVHGRIAAVDWDVRRDLIRLLVKRVEIDRNEVNVVFRVAPPPDPCYAASDHSGSLHHCGRGDHRALRRARLRCRDDPVFHHPGLQPFADQTDHARIADPVRDEADQPVVADRLEEARDVGVQDPVHLRALDPDREGVQRVVRAAPRPEAVREPEEVRLEDGVQHLDHRTLDDLVLQRRDAERALSAVRLGDGHPP
jgi:site-specific DNA recombinase